MIIFLLQVDHNNDGFVDKEEFLNLVNNRGKYLTKRQESMFRQYLQVVAYAEEYRWCPPPWFTIVMTILQIGLYVLHTTSHDGTFEPTCSLLIYSPRRRQEAWRFLTYMFVHADIQHILFNMSMQLLVGLPLEMSHGTRRVALVYGFGVVAGSLATSVFDPKVFLAGASGGVYALVTAHLATLVLNWQEDMVILQHRLRGSQKRTAAKLHGPIVRCLRLGVVLLYAAIDTSVAVIRRSTLNIR
jgi:membrane associated rhomboid family serine protease